MSAWTYTLTYVTGTPVVYASDVTDVTNWDQVNWGADPKLVRVDRTSNDGQAVTVWSKSKTAGGSGMPESYGWVPGAIAAMGVVGAFGLGMWLLGRPVIVSVIPTPPRIKELQKKYQKLGYDVRDITFQEGSNAAEIRFTDANGHEQKHDWFFDGKDWRCSLTGELE